MTTTDQLLDTPPTRTQPAVLFARTRLSRADAEIFAMKLGIAVIITATGIVLALSRNPLLTAAGVVMIAGMYVHAVELQHQCLHHSAFRVAWLHRVIGIPLGLPFLVSYSHYRVRHLQHHRYLGTPQDSEFFGFDIRQRLTFWLLLRYMFDFRRLLHVLRDVWQSACGTWQYGLGQIGTRARKQIMSEYRLIGILLLGLCGLSAVGWWSLVLRLWLLPLLVALPIHFIVELPEHILCDVDSTDVLVNTRSITGSWFSTWFTNANNLHIEHHAAMIVPLNRLRERHHEVVKAGKYVERTYFQAYRHLIQAAFAGSKE